MDCTQARNLLSEYQDGTLDAAAEATLAAHLRGCGDCAGRVASLLAVREFLRGLPPDPAPPELLERVLAAVGTENRDNRADSDSRGADATRPFLSRFRIPLEAAAAVLLFAAVYWYQQIPAPADRPSPGLSTSVPSEAIKAPPSPPMAAKEEAVKAPPSRPIAAKEEAVKALPSRSIVAKEEAAPAPVTAREAASSLPAPRTWAAGSLPSVPVYFASTSSERVGPAEPDGGARFRLTRSFASPPSHLLRSWPYGRDIVVDMKPESREGAEERIAEATFRFGGIVERIERESEPTMNVGTGTVRVVLPEAAAGGFLDELRRIGTLPSEGPPSASDIPAGPRPGTVAYAVRIRVR